MLCLLAVTQIGTSEALTGFALILDFGLGVHSHAVFSLSSSGSGVSWTTERERKRERKDIKNGKEVEKEKSWKTASEDPAAAHISPNRSAFNLTAREEKASRFSPAVVMHHKFCLHSLLGISSSHLLPNILMTLPL